LEKHWEARGFLDRVLARKDGQTLLDLSYTRNAKGQVTGITSPDAGRSWTYAFDGLHLASVDLDPRYLTGYPVQLSGGERQRCHLRHAQPQLHKESYRIGQGRHGSASPHLLMV
jgi:YD repeat-containing protein